MSCQGCFQSQRLVSHSLNFRIFYSEIHKTYTFHSCASVVLGDCASIQNAVEPDSLSFFFMLGLLDVQNKLTSSFITVFFCQVTLPRDLIMDSGETGEKEGNCQPERICRVGQICAFSPSSVSVQSCHSRWHYDHHQRGHLVSSPIFYCLSSDLIVPNRPFCDLSTKGC